MDKMKQNGIFILLSMQNEKKLVLYGLNDVLIFLNINYNNAITCDEG
jgi:hypothetical protein